MRNNVKKKTAHSIMAIALCICVVSAFSFPLANSEAYAVSKPGKVKTLNVSGSSKASLNWSKVKKASGYQISMDGNAVKMTKSRSASISISGAGTHTFKVRAYKSYKQNQYYNTSKCKWQKKKPKKSAWVGKQTRKVTLYKYGKWSPQKSRNFSAGGSSGGTISPSVSEPLDVNNNKDITFRYLGAEVPRIYYRAGQGYIPKEGFDAMLKLGRDYDITQHGNLNNGWKATCVAKGYYKGTFIITDFEANYLYHESIIKEMCKGKSDPEKFDILVTYCSDGYCYGGDVMKRDGNMDSYGSEIAQAANGFFYNHGLDCYGSQRFINRIIPALGMKSMCAWSSGHAHALNLILYTGEDGVLEKSKVDFSAYNGKGEPNLGNRIYGKSTAGTIINPAMASTSGYYYRANNGEEIRTDENLSAEEWTSFLTRWANGELD